MQDEALIVLLRTVRRAIDDYLCSVDGEETYGVDPARPMRLGIDQAVFDAAKAFILSSVVERTGYPEEMLDLDLDLEADLGIDSIKQVAILAAAREQWNVLPDPDFKIRDHNTLRKLITYFAERLETPDYRTASARL
jgi:acyl carrier protein